MELKCFIWHIVDNHRIIGWENVFKSVRLIKIMSAFHNNAIIQYILCSFVRIHGVKLRLKRFSSLVSHFVIENYVFTAKRQQVREIWLVCIYKIVFSVFCLVWVIYFVIYYICKTEKIEDKMQYYMDEKGFPKIRNWTR